MRANYSLGSFVDAIELTFGRFLHVPLLIIFENHTPNSAKAHDGVTAPRNSSSHSKGITLIEIGQTVSAALGSA